MTKRTRRLAGCFGTLLILALLLVLTNVALGMYFRHQGAVIAREMSAKGYPSTFVELVAKQNSDSAAQREAMADLLEAFAAFDDDELNYDLTPASTVCDLPPPGEPIPPEILAEMDKFVSMNQDVLVRLKAAAVAGVAHVPMRSALEWDSDVMNCANGLRKCSRLLLVESVYLAETGNADAALDSLETLAPLSNALASQPSVAAYLVGTAIMAQAAAEDLLERDYLKEPRQFERLAAIMETEQRGDAAYASWTDALMSEARSYTEPRPKTTFQEVLGAVHPMEHARDFFLPYVVPFTFLNELDHYNEKRVALLLSDSLDEPLLAGNSRMEGAASEGTLSWLYLRPSSALTSEYLPWIEGLHRARARTMGTAARVVAYQKQHGRIPEQDAFEMEIHPPADPFDGKPLRYQKTEAGFLIYSVGLNGIDDGGARCCDRPSADDDAVEIRLPK